MLLFSNLNYFAAFIFTTMRAHAVRQLGFVTVRAFRYNGPAQRIMGPPRGSAALGMSSFGIRHGSWFLSFSGRTGVSPLCAMCTLMMKLSQRGPAVIGLRRPAPAFLLIPVLPANRADTLAIVLA